MEWLHFLLRTSSFTFWEVYFRFLRLCTHLFRYAADMLWINSLNANSGAKQRQNSCQESLQESSCECYSTTCTCSILDHWQCKKLCCKQVQWYIRYCCDEMSMVSVTMSQWVKEQKSWLLDESTGETECESWQCRNEHKTLDKWFCTSFVLHVTSIWGKQEVRT